MTPSLFKILLVKGEFYHLAGAHPEINQWALAVSSFIFKLSLARVGRKAS
jgi:hypothetical protein